MCSLENKTVFITGGSRGIGLAIAQRFAKAGANIVIAAKTIAPNSKLPGTIYSAAESIKALGANCLPVQADIRDELQIQQAVQQAVDAFGGIDILINNASAIQLTPTDATPIKRFDLMFGVNVRGTFAVTQACLPHLKASAVANRNPHVLSLSPPLNMHPKWFAPHLAYTMAKYGMSMCVLGHAQEFAPHGIAVNALWPRTVIQTAALQMIPGIRPEQCRTTDILADAAYEIVLLNVHQPAHTGNFYIDEDVLKRDAHLANFDKYSVVPGSESLLIDLFLE